jgi:hypothetical protein
MKHSRLDADPDGLSEELANHFLECCGTSVFQTHRIDELLRHL